MIQSLVDPQFKTLAGTTIAIILGFALVIFLLNLEASRVSASSNDSTSTLKFGNTAGPLVIEVAPRIAVNQVGDPHTVVATVTATGSQPVTGATVHFGVVAGPNVGLTGSAITNDDGEAPFTYSSSSKGIDIVQACVNDPAIDSTSGQACDLSVKWWIGSPPQREIDLSPDSASNPVGTSHTVTATLSERGSPLSGVLVEFEVLAGPNVGLTVSSDTNDGGEAPFVYTGTAAGVDTIQACASDGSSGRVCDQALKQWTSGTPDRFIGLEPARAINPIGTSHTVMATVTEGDRNFPSNEVLVEFEVISGPTAGVTGSATTDRSGEAPFAYTGTAVGLDTIQACTGNGDARVCDLAAKQWTPVDGRLTLDLSPRRASNPVGTSHTVTATVSTRVSPSGPDREYDRVIKGRSSPVSGAQVDFEVISGPTAGITGSATTDSSGQAPFTYTGTATGLDTIRACTDRGDGRVCDQAAKKWTGDQPSPDGTSCRGEHSCRGRIVSVGADSCNAKNSCNGNNISVGDNSCNEEDSCRGNTNRIGNRSCNGEESCRGNSQQIADGSCNDQEACRGNRNQIGDASCNGEEACAGNNMIVEDNQCNQDAACRSRNRAGTGGDEIDKNQNDEDSSGFDQQSGNGGGSQKVKIRYNGHRGGHNWKDRD